MLAGCLEAERFAAEEEIIVQGDIEKANKMYIIAMGEAKAVVQGVYGMDGKGTVKTYQAGDFFGELALLKKAPRAASVLSVRVLWHVATISRAYHSLPCCYGFSRGLANKVIVLTRLRCICRWGRRYASRLQRWSSRRCSTLGCSMRCVPTPTSTLAPNNDRPYSSRKFIMKMKSALVLSYILHRVPKASFVVCMRGVFSKV